MYHPMVCCYFIPLIWLLSSQAVLSTDKIYRYCFSNLKLPSLPWLPGSVLHLCKGHKMNCCFSMNNFGKSVGSSCLGWGEGDNYMMQNPAQLHLHINRPNQKCKLQSEEILKARDNWADNKRSNSHIAEGFKLLSVSGNSFFTSKM